MSTPNTDSWQELFATTSDGERVTLNVVSRGGKPFLFLPADRVAAARALDLYPAQTWKARLAKSALSLMLRVGLRPGLPKISQSIASSDPFTAFLRATARLGAGERLSFAVLSGNPSAPGPRHVFLLFNSASQPMVVVKAGASERARELIAQEVAILAGFSSRQSGLPKLRDKCELGNVSAFAMDFIEGTSPGDDAAGELGEIFSSWVDSATEITIGETAAWQRLIQSCVAPVLPDAAMALGKLRVFPVLMHGDFAPWNVKVSAGRWTVLDWERGERVGIPAWDWFHYVVQPAVLVKREATATTMARLEKLFASTEFQSYAKRCGIVGSEWNLAFTYVNYCIHVTRQTEGLRSLESLRAAIQSRTKLERAEAF